MPARSRGIASSVHGRPARPAGRGRASRRLGSTFVVPAGVLVVLIATALAQPRGPSALVASRSPTAVVTPTVDQASFIRRVGGVAQRFRAVVGLPPSLVTAMAINETGWGSSELTRRANNYFGIKADVGEGTAGRVVADTREVVDGRVVTVRAAFRAYRSLDESVQDLGAFLRANSRYDAIWARAHDPRASAAALAQAGYGTDPAWADKLITLIDGFDLEALDAPAWVPDWWPNWSRT
jgi:flagellum-specific peptidoglycan hydrolase FlgJ